MRIIVILLALLAVGFLISRQLDTGSGSTAEIEKAAEGAGMDVPRVPSRPQDVQGFEQDMNKFMNDAAAERAKQIEQAEQ